MPGKNESQHIRGNDKAERKTQDSSARDILNPQYIEPHIPYTLDKEDKN